MSSAFVNENARQDMLDREADLAVMHRQRRVGHIYDGRGTIKVHNPNRKQRSLGIAVGEASRQARSSVSVEPVAIATARHQVDHNKATRSSWFLTDNTRRAYTVQLAAVGAGIARLRADHAKAVRKCQHERAAEIARKIDVRLRLAVELNSKITKP